MLKGWTTSISLGSYSTHSCARANAVEEGQGSDLKHCKVKRNLKKLDIGESLCTFFASIAYVPLFSLELQNRLF